MDRPRDLGSPCLGLEELVTAGGFGGIMGLVFDLEGLGDVDLFPEAIASVFSFKSCAALREGRCPSEHCDAERGVSVDFSAESVLLADGAITLAPLRTSLSMYLFHSVFEASQWHGGGVSV